MRLLIISSLLLLTSFSCQNSAVNTTDTAPAEKPLSPHETAMIMIGDAHIHLDYSSPGVRGRTIFGELIPYGELWRAGANDATWIETNRDLLINNQVLPAGKYGFFVVPNTDKWTIVINQRWDQHGANKYQENEDVLRVDVKPVLLTEVKEHLIYELVQVSEDSGLLSLAWEKIRVELPFAVSELNQ
ncbi:DUF2911 domain-containing protein [Phaeodactylibacter sp.]|uniref:DUF2911 domain-containing protein n=1 Tax=Phaeodactylibacter sp. TaxID=1940289 RepID=UPI0025FF6FD5|nr:DUF2911 domain-containing protein [Phaeodactylibacter sp.]MCI5092692.1 DUF2911 domain-containing protein [Phaeodactylibacter sp.]